MRKHLLFLVASLAAALVVAAGCGPAGEPSSDKPAGDLKSDANGGPKAGGGDANGVGQAPPLQPPAGGG